MMKTIEGYTYRVNQHIGKGYSSTVHKGLNDQTGEEVSIKVIEMAKLQDPINQMLLQLEVTALKTLSNSKHILHLYDVYATKNNTYLITQLCEGDLSTLIKQRKTIPYYQVVQIMRQLIIGFYDLYKAGFIHRDIKPANIFYKNGVYKIGDFGFTIPIVEVHNHKHYNVGSPVYMPPQALKENVYSISCDIWALGIIFYQLLKGAVPWRAISEKILYQKITSEPIDNLTIGMPEVARTFLAQILCLDPKQRATPESLLHWPAQLQSVHLDLRSITPCQQQTGRITQPLRQVNSNIPNYQTSHVGYLNHHQFSSGNPNQNKLIHFFTPKDQIPINQMPKELSQIKPDEMEFKEAYFFACNFISFIKFLHRCIKFLAPPTPLQLKSLEYSIAKYMYCEFAKLKVVIQQKSQYVNLKIQHWGEFIASHKGELIRKKFKNYEAKYKMFHQMTDDAQDLNEMTIFEGITQIMNYLQKQQNYNPKLIIAADYLTTLYQLVHLRQKYEPKQFIKISKIDMIMQGSPYNATPDHLQKLKRKILLISP